MIKREIKHVVSGVTEYTITILLDAKAKDFGFFDTFSGGTITPITGTSFNVITGTSSSRLYEIRKYTTTGSLSDLYFTITGSTNDGLDLANTITGITASTYAYRIGGINYVDQIVGSATTTTFTCKSLGLNDPNNFDNTTIIKDESKENIINNPFIESDVFIIRQEIPVFERSIRLRGVSTLNDILVYAGGNYFKIFNNT